MEVADPVNTFIKMDRHCAAAWLTNLYSSGTPRGTPITLSCGRNIVIGKSSDTNAQTPVATLQAGLFHNFSQRKITTLRRDNHHLPSKSVEIHYCITLYPHYNKIKIKEKNIVQHSTKNNYMNIGLFVWSRFNFYRNRKDTTVP